MSMVLSGRREQDEYRRLRYKINPSKYRQVMGVVMSLYIPTGSYILFNFCADKVEIVILPERELQKMM